MSDLLACPLPHPALPAAELDEDTRALVDRIGHHAFYSQFGHAPEIIKGWLQWYQPLMMNGRLDIRVKEISRLRVAALNGCHY